MYVNLVPLSLAAINRFNFKLNRQTLIKHFSFRFVIYTTQTFEKKCNTRLHDLVASRCILVLILAIVSSKIIYLNLEWIYSLNENIVPNWEELFINLNAEKNVIAFSHHDYSQYQYLEKVFTKRELENSIWIQNGAVLHFKTSINFQRVTEVRIWKCFLNMPLPVRV